ncbi:MAG TPA: AraC family ligand binding domain-containing protein [Stellaceae bacterium]|nr:AraC family ligand binding domain-containing protein [Stellaceae bacterium]
MNDRATGSTGCGPRRPRGDRADRGLLRGTRLRAAHRHDTYAVGVTLEGVQSFGYRGAAAHSVAGQVFVIHPDETHDGDAGTDAGFRYRVLHMTRHFKKAYGVLPGRWAALGLRR